ncbi:MAG: RimK/LysX family protein [Pseudomonadota bacterium]
MLLFSLFTLLATTVGVQETYTRGWVEHARIMPDRLLMSAKLDSGAQTTSIHADILAAGSANAAIDDQSLADQLADTESDARAMLSIRMMDGPTPDDPPALEVSPLEDAIEAGEMPDIITFRLTSRGGKEIIYTEPVVRWVSIRRRGGGFIVRPVVMMDLCIAGVRVRGEVNLADRSGFNYPLLIGRNMLSDAGISVDSRQIFAARRACPEDE